MRDHVTNPDAEVKEMNGKLIKQLEAEGFDYIKTLVKAHDVGTLTTLVTTKNDVVRMRDPDFQRTPLLYASEYSTLEMVKMLAKHGADLTVRDVLGQTATNLATRWNKSNDCDIIKWMCGIHKELLYAECNAGYNMFHWATYYKKANVINVLLQFAPSKELLYKENEVGFTPIGRARDNRYGKLQLILEMYEDYLEKCAR